MLSSAYGAEHPAFHRLSSIAFPSRAHTRISLEHAHVGGNDNYDVALFSIKHPVVTIETTKLIDVNTQTRAFAIPLRRFHDMMGHHRTSRIVVSSMQPSICLLNLRSV